MTGFLAEEDQFDRRSLWRLGSWGVGAVGAVVVAVLAHQSSIGLRREQIASVDLARQSQQIQSIAKESQNETRRLASAIDTLNGDRDRLYSRITVLEQGLDSVTGSIARQNAAPASPQATPAVFLDRVFLAGIIHSMVFLACVVLDAARLAGRPLDHDLRQPALAGTIGLGHFFRAGVYGRHPPPRPNRRWPKALLRRWRRSQPRQRQKTRQCRTNRLPFAASEPASVTTAPPTRPMASNAPAATPATPLMPAKSIMAPPDAAAGKLMAPDIPPDTAATAPGPEVVAASHRTSDRIDAKADDAPAASTVQRTEFAVDVGTANSVGGLRALWRGLLKSKSNAALAALRPIIVVKEGNNGLGMQLRLVAGPLGDAAAAAKICAAMLEGKRVTCETTVFDGQQLALKDDEPQASARPAPARPAAAPAQHCQAGDGRGAAQAATHDAVVILQQDDNTTINRLQCLAAGFSHFDFELFARPTGCPAARSPS